MDQLKLHQLNDVRLVGRLTRDPELRYTPKGQPICRFRLAVGRRFRDRATNEWREETAYVPVASWRDLAERCAEKLKKGSPVYVEGRLRSRDWETKDGQKRSDLEVEAWRVQFLFRELEAEGPIPVGVAGESDAGEPSSAPEPSSSPQAQKTEETLPPVSEEEVPF